MKLNYLAINVSLLFIKFFIICYRINLPNLRTYNFFTRIRRILSTRLALILNKLIWDYSYRALQNPYNFYELIKRWLNKLYYYIRSVLHKITFLILENFLLQFHRSARAWEMLCMCSLIKNYKNFYYNHEFENSIKYNGINFSRVQLPWRIEISHLSLAVSSQNWRPVSRCTRSKRHITCC